MTDTLATWEAYRSARLAYDAERAELEAAQNISRLNDGPQLEPLEVDMCCVNNATVKAHSCRLSY